MKLVQSFDPIEVGEIDTFAFDLTARIVKSPGGPRDLVTAQWTARLTPFSRGVDLNPQSRINSMWVGSSITTGTGQQLTGQFAFAQIGPMPVSAAGATYIFDVHAFLANGDIIADNASVLCVLPGQ